MSLYLGIDIGGSSFKYGWGNSEGLRHFDSIPIKHKTMEHFMQQASTLLSIVDDRVSLQHIKAIGIGSPGTIDSISGRTCGVNPNLPFWINYRPSDIIPSFVKTPVFCDNDANLMALAEANHHGCRHLLGITVGSGIGGGLVLGGELYHGSNGYAGEFGHQCVERDGLKCNCGRNGCLEAYSSVDGLRRSLAKHDSKYLSMELSELLNVNDSIVIEAIMKAHSLLVTSIVNIVTVLDLECIVLGGGAMDAGLYQVSEIEQDVNTHLPEANKGKVRVLKAYHGNQAGVMGAILLAEKGIS
jgi:predicted NBD/HSP70 family sugar kinase